MHFMGGRCAASKAAPVYDFPDETGLRPGIDRRQLWAVVDAARVLLGRARTGRAGSASYELAADRLELELGRLPEEVWKK